MKLVAFIIGPQGIAWKDTYYDRFIMDKKRRPWLENVPKEYYLDKHGDKYKKTTKELPYIRIDVAVAYGLIYMLKNNNEISIDILTPKDITIKKFEKYDLIINQFMDELIVPFLKRFEKSGIPHKKLKDVYTKFKDKIYPPLNYQNMIVNKCDYYKFLKNKEVPVLPTFCIKKTDVEQNQGQVLKDLNAYITKHKLKSIFTKPVHGTDSSGIKLFKKVSTETFSPVLLEHMKELFKNKQYPGIILQKHAPDFEKHIPQARMYFIGHKYMYTVLNKNDDTYRPQEENKSSKVKDNLPLDCLKKQAKRILKLLQPLFGKTPMLITRIDFGCCLNKPTNNVTKQCLNFFVNEIEFNPGNYVHMDLNHERRFMFDKHVIKQLIKVVSSNKRLKYPSATKLTKILIMKTRMPPFEPVDKKCRQKWLSKSNKKIGVDESVVKYINYKYANDGIIAHYKDPFKVDLKQYDAIYIGLEYWSLAHVLHENGSAALKKYVNLLQSIDPNKLILPYKFVNFSYDKCDFNKMMKTLKIPAAPTHCMEIASNTNLIKTFEKIKSYNWGKVFVKAIPGESSHDTFSYEQSDSSYFMKKIKQVINTKKYTNIVFQKFMPSFATEKHPELRTFWIGNKYQLGVKTATTGYYKGVIKRLPSVIQNHTKRLIEHLEKLYKFSFVCARFDWGYDPEMGYFINEMELLPGFFNEEMKNNLPSCKWNLDVGVGDRLVHIMKKSHINN